MASFFNLKGSAIITLAIGLVAAAFTYFVFFISGTNDYADIPAVKAAASAKSYEEVFTVSKGETLRIIGCAKLKEKVKNNSKGKPEEVLHLLVFNSRGERDFVPVDVVTPEQLEEMMPELSKHCHAPSNGSNLFNRITLTKAQYEKMVEDATVEDIEQVLVSPVKIKTEKGKLSCLYYRAEVFDKSTGRFYNPKVSFSRDGKVLGSELVESGKTHWNAWLLKFLPGTEWIYSHNIYNHLSAKKNFSKLSSGPFSGQKIHLNDWGFFGTVLGIALIILIFAVIFGLYCFTPVIPAYLINGLFVLPFVAKPLRADFIRSILIIASAAVCVYFTWLAAMPYMTYLITLPALAGAAVFALSFTMDDDVCSKCGFFNTYVFDHDEYIGEHQETRKSSESHCTGSTSFKYKTYDEYSDGSKRNWQTHTGYQDEYRNDVYDVTYNVKEYKEYYICTKCGNIRTRIRRDETAIDKRYLSSYGSSQTRY